MTDMMKKGKSMCNSMKNDMGNMDDMMKKGMDMCDSMMGSNDNSSSCSSNDTTSSCSSSNADMPKSDEGCSDGSCAL